MWSYLSLWFLLEIQQQDGSDDDLSTVKKFSSNSSLSEFDEPTETSEETTLIYTRTTCDDSNLAGNVRDIERQPKEGKTPLLLYALWWYQNLFVIKHFSGKDLHWIFNHLRVLSLDIYVLYTFFW